MCACWCRRGKGEGRKTCTVEYDCVVLCVVCKRCEFAEFEGKVCKR